MATRTIAPFGLVLVALSQEISVTLDDLRDGAEITASRWDDLMGGWASPIQGELWRLAAVVHQHDGSVEPHAVVARLARSAG
jgi:hypothetical protein